MRLRYSASVFGGITQLLFILSLGAFTSASPIDTSAMSESSPNPLIERTRPSEQRKCFTIFGKPSYSDCKAAIGQIGQISGPRQFYVNPQDQSNQLPNTYLPLGHISGQYKSHLFFQRSKFCELPLI